MQIKVKVITRSKFNKVEKEKDVFVIRTSAVPESGRANLMVQKLLSDYFSVSKSKVKILKGEKCRNKEVWVDVEN